MKLKELSGILRGSATVNLPDCGYLVSNDDVSYLIDAYGDYEVEYICGTPDAGPAFSANTDECYPGVMYILLSDAK